MTTPALVTPDLTDFVRTEYPRVVSTVRGIAGTHDAAADAVHDALVQLLADTGRDWPRNVAAWVTVVASNRARDIRRREALAIRVADKLRPGSPGNPVDDSIAELDLQAMLDTLPPRMRQVCAMHYLHDRSVIEIAARLGIGTGTVKTQLSRGRMALARGFGVTANQRPLTD
jgi:RNA polymerase sigma-70 factor (ECF subfamily)